jgi:predicted transcriptional regulator
MDKIFSARVDESTVRRIGILAQRLNTTKKNIIESAIEVYASRIEEEYSLDVLDLTFGAWRREESAPEVVDASRKAFRHSMMRHQE